WYEAKMTDPTFKIPAEDMIKAFQAATAEGGQWHDYMFKIMDSYNGMVDRLGEEGKETLGEFFKPFFDMAKDEAIPGLIDSLDKFRTWISENQEPLQNLADSVGKIVNVGFEGFLNMLQWMVDNGDLAGKGLATIATGFGLVLANAHPLAASILAIVGGLALLKSRSEELKSGEIFGKYSEEELSTLQKYIEALKELNVAEVAKAQSGDAKAETARWEAAKDAVNQYAREVNKTDGLMQDYWDYSRKQGGNQSLGIVVDLPVKTTDGSESDVQTEINTWTLEALVKMYADATGVQSDLNSMHFTAYADLVTRGSTGITNVNGSHAGGLDEVPFDGYIARLHKGEAVLNSTNAEAWRSGSMGMGNTGRLEGMMAQLISLTQQLVSSGGKQVVLDSGVLVGQLAPALDAQLGTISSRKGRRN
ncbi:MAG: hypothetical protein J6V25_00600, partial [Oscillospiraceae bacterium]|nr:hypothetical protein [Oscillospiraceae bacterium]